MVASRQTRLKLRKGFHNAPISYWVPMNRQFNDKDQKEIAKGLAKASTPDKAKALLPAPGKPSTWKLEMVTGIKDCGCYKLMYKGLEVAIFWKRQLSEVMPDPSDPVPEGVLEHDDDIWARLDLDGKSPRQLMKVVQDELDDKARLEATITSLQRVKEADDKTIQLLRSEIEALKTKPKKSKK